MNDVWQASGALLALFLMSDLAPRKADHHAVGAAACLCYLPTVLARELGDSTGRFAVTGRSEGGSDALKPCSRQRRCGFRLFRPLRHLAAKKQSCSPSSFLTGIRDWYCVSPAHTSENQVDQGFWPARKSRQAPVLDRFLSQYLLKKKGIDPQALL